MSTRTVNLRDFSKVLGGFSEHHLVELRNATARGVARSIPDVVATSPVDTGLYAQSWDMTVDELSVTLGNTSPHAPIIEHGARPFTPPLGPLLAWAKRVLGDPSQPPEYSDQVWALAVGTQKKIEKYGMEPKHVMENAIPGIIANIEAEYKQLG